MQQPEGLKPAQPLPHPPNESGALLRELTVLRLVRLLDFMSRSASRAFPRVSGLSDFEWRVVVAVCGTPQLSINEISARLHRGAAQISRTVKKLVAAGLLHRASRKGGPGVLITPTRLGRTAYSPLKRLARQRNAAILAGLSAEEIKGLDHCIAIMTTNAWALLEREQRLQKEDGRRSQA